MIGYSGWGLLPVLLPVIPFVVWINIADYGRGDWATACLVAALVALLLGALNLGIAALLNRDDSPQEDRMVWTGAHRSGGTALQSYTPMFLALAGAALAGWTIQWVPWQVAVGGYLAGIVAYFALPALSRRRVRAVAIVNRLAFVGTPPGGADRCAPCLLRRSGQPAPAAVGSGWYSLVPVGIRWYPLAGRLGARALVAQGIEQRFPNPWLPSFRRR